MNPLVRTAAIREYGSEVEQVRNELGPALRALEALAAAPDELWEAADELPPLQYALHVAGERMLGLDPLPGLEEAHEELTVALAIAREETADVLGAVEREDPAAGALVWEWRAALFGVRLALAKAALPVAHEEPLPSTIRAAVPVALLVGGVLSVLGGALASFWPVWALGLALVAIASALSRHAAPP